MLGAQEGEHCLLGGRKTEEGLQEVAPGNPSAEPPRSAPGPLHVCFHAHRRPRGSPFTPQPSVHGRGRRAPTLTWTCFPSPQRPLSLSLSLEALGKPCPLRHRGLHVPAETGRASSAHPSPPCEPRPSLPPPSAASAWAHGRSHSAGLSVPGPGPGRPPGCPSARPAGSQDSGPTQHPVPQPRQAGEQHSHRGRVWSDPECQVGLRGDGPRSGVQRPAGVPCPHPGRIAAREEQTFPGPRATGLLPRGAGRGTSAGHCREAALAWGPPHGRPERRCPVPALPIHRRVSRPDWPPPLAPRLQGARHRPGLTASSP